MTTSCFALCGRSAFIWTGLVPLLLFAIVSWCLLIAPLAPCRKMLFRSFCAMSLPQLGRLDLRWAPFGPMTSVVYSPLLRSTAAGLSQRFWSPPLGAPVQCFRPFTSAAFSMNTMAFALWVRSWLRVRGSSSPHLFLTCSGGEGGALSPLSPLLRGSFTCYSGWMRGLPIQWLSGAGVPSFFYFILFLTFYSFCFFLFICFIACPSLKQVPWGCAIWTHDVTSDWVDLGPPSSHFQDSVASLTCSHDSQLL